MIHIRNIPNESSETEVIQLGVAFGRVTNVLVLKGKNQAFLEMADEVSAAAIVACFNTNPPLVRGRTVYVQFSNHRELKTDQSHSVAVSFPPLYLYRKNAQFFICRIFPKFSKFSAFLLKYFFFVYGLSNHFCIKNRNQLQLLTYTVSHHKK